MSQGLGQDHPSVSGSKLRPRQLAASFISQARQARHLLLPLAKENPATLQDVGLAFSSLRQSAQQVRNLRGLLGRGGSQGTCPNLLGNEPTGIARIIVPGHWSLLDLLGRVLIKSTASIDVRLPPTATQKRTLPDFRDEPQPQIFEIHLTARNAVRSSLRSLLDRPRSHLDRLLQHHGELRNVSVQRFPLSLNSMIASGGTSTRQNAVGGAPST
jgi:hypothetical protein